MEPRRRLFAGARVRDLRKRLSLPQAAMAARLGVWMFNVHVQGGSAMLKEAAAAAKRITEVSLNAPMALRAAWSATGKSGVWSWCVAKEPHV